MLTKEQYPNYSVASIRTCPPLAQTLSCRCSHTHTQTCAHTLTHTDTHTSTYINWKIPLAKENVNDKIYII